MKSIQRQLAKRLKRDRTHDQGRNKGDRHPAETAHDSGRGKRRSGPKEECGWHKQPRIVAIPRQRTRDQNKTKNEKILQVQARSRLRFVARTFAGRPPDTRGGGENEQQYRQYRGRDVFTRRRNLRQRDRCSRCQFRA